MKKKKIIIYTGYLFTDEDVNNSLISMTEKESIEEVKEWAFNELEMDYTTALIRDDD